MGAGDDISSGPVRSRIVSMRRPTVEFWGSCVIVGDPSLHSWPKVDASGCFFVANALSPPATVSFPEPHIPALENAMCCLELRVLLRIKKARGVRSTSAAPTPPTDEPAIVPVFECLDATGAVVVEV